jgi:hypothetical protein
MEKGIITLWLAVVLSLLQSLPVTNAFSFSRGLGLLHSPSLLASKEARVEFNTGDELKLQDLVMSSAELIKNHRANSTSSFDGDEEAYCRSLLANRQPQLFLSRCHVATSAMEGAGKGVFASRDIAAGELITLYPGDAVLYWPSGDRSPGQEVPYLLHYSLTYFFIDFLTCLLYLRYNFLTGASYFR